MNEPINTTCNGCQKNFKINKLRKIKVNDGIDKYYFRCPNCKHEYVGYYSSAETVKLQKQVRKHLQSISKQPTDHESLKAFWNQADVLKAAVKRSMDDARRISEG